MADTTSNLKDTLTTWCGVLFAVSSGIVAAAMGGLALPSWLTASSGAVAAISGGIIGFLTGKAPNATKKTDSQVEAGNAPNPPVLTK